MIQVGSLKERLVELIDGLDLQEGGQLPTERAMATQLGVARWTIRQALNRLEAEGHIWRHVGRGTFLGARPTPSHEDMRALADYCRPSELIEARMLIEPSLAALAATRATEDQVQRIIEVERKCASARNMEIYEIWDEKLHQTIAEASGNSLLCATFFGLNVVRKKIVWGRMKRSVLKAHRRQFYSRHHQRIVHAIINRDADAARRAMAEHMRSLKSIYLRIEGSGLGEDDPLSL